jgi:hypothetical protein
MVYLMGQAPPKIYNMIKMLKMQKIPNLFFLVYKDDQLAYFTMLTPINVLTIL